MSNALATLFYLLVVLAFAAAVQGVWLTLRTYAGEGRTLSRRLARASHAPEQTAREEDERSPADRFLDTHAPWLRARLATAASPLRPSQVALGAGGMTLTFFLLMQLAHMPALLSLLAAVWGGVASPILLLSFLAARRRKQFVAQMPAAVDLMARSLQAGHPVTTAMSVAARQMPDPVGPELAKVMAEMSAGLDRDTALRNLIRRFPVPELRMFVASLEVTRETGGNLSEVLLKLGDALRSKAQLRKKVSAISAEGRMTFWVVVALPPAVAGILSTLNPDYYKAAMPDPLFWPLMSVPPVLLLIGALVIWRMINFRI
ncbi:type II secretion system F family protein [Phenylobacterium deserti]|uniref:Type II secretion system protein GspF domain-containing protein n=1 Tax=Phenylobacterium deserti TaxID=1914756 RepID=A0A328ACQ4_9CAUL|nr:type II secretion system F family protein [Phenylobacterium deserti]RAK52532.1 hypothetical protein DJ018_09975 [Phenylobacterium deserti]